MTARSRYDGFPRVFLSGDKEKALAHLGRAKSLLSEVQRIREVANVAVFQRSIIIDGVEITAKSIGEQNALYVHAATSVADKKTTSAYSYPVVLSGYIQARLLNEATPVPEFVEFKAQQKARLAWEKAQREGRAPTEEEIQLTAEEAADARQPMGWFAPSQDTVRVYGALLDQQTTQPHLTNVLRADTGGAYQSMDGLNPDTGAKYRAYRYVKGTWVTGKLSTCHQVVLGLHYMSSRRALELEPEFLQEDQASSEAYAQTHRMALPSYVQAVDRARGFFGDYNFRWDKSDGLVRGFSGWWLVRIQQHRILAKKLPIFYGSDLPEFIAHYKEKQLWRLVEVIEALGGLPTGESFGTEQDIQNGLADGSVLDITPGGMPLSGYYASYESCGWSFSEDGREAHNTGLRYAAGEDIHYCRWATVMFQPENVGGVEHLSARILVNSDRAIFVPKRRMNYVDYQSIPLKVPFGYQGEVISVDLGTIEGGLAQRRKKVYDVPVWAGYVGGALHVINYYLNALAEPREDWSGEQPPEDCPYGGSWEWEVDRGITPGSPCLYTNVWDTRTTLYAGGTRWKRDSIKAYEYISGSHLIPNPEWAVFSPKAVYRERNQVWAKGADWFGSFATVYTDRSNYVVSSVLMQSAQESYQETYAYKTVGGPWEGWSFRCFVWGSYEAPCLDPGKALSEYCNQNCNYMMGGTHNDTTDRMLCVTYTTVPGCWDLVDIEPPARCTPMTSYFTAPPQPALPAGNPSNEAKYAYTYSGYVYTPVAEVGYKYNPVPLEMDYESGIIPRPSPDPYSQTTHWINSTRNCVGYDYSCFNINLLGTMGSGKVGVLHTGVTTLRTDLTFVGVPD